MDLIKYLDKCTIKKYNQLKEAKYYALIGCKNHKRSFFMNEIDIYLWLKERELWTLERPSLLLYAKLLTSVNFFSNLPEKILFDALKAMNYYGNYSDVIKIAKNKKKSISEENYFKLIKHLGKAYKSLGYHEEAINLYREAIEVAIKKKDELLIAFFLVLTAKLFDDYQQKKGMHMFYHKLAYGRLKNNMEIKTKENYSKIFSICADCYSKSIYKENPKLSNEIYKKIFKEFTLNSEQYIRIKLNHLITQIENQLDKFNTKKCKTILKKFKIIDDYIKIVEDNKNDRACAIRNIQKYKLYRKFIENLIKNNLVTELNEFLGEYSIEYILNRLKFYMAICEKYQESKFQAYALLESAKLLNIQMKINSDSFFWHIKQEIQELEEAKKIIIIPYSNNKPLVSAVYIDIIVELSTRYTKIKCFSEALLGYQTLYNHFNLLLNDIKKVSNEIGRIIIDNKKSFSEYKIFSLEEMTELKMSLFLDYETLTNRLLEVGRNINSIHNMDIQNFVDEIIAFSKTINYHNLSSLVTNIRQECEMKLLNKKKIITYLNAIDNKIKDISESNDSLFPNEYFDPFIEAENCISKSEFELINGTIEVKKNSNSNLSIYYCKKYFNIILSNLIYNIKQTAVKENMQTFIAQINFSESLIDDNKIVFLHIEDNVGNIEIFEKVIKNINDMSFDKIYHDRMHGTGLKTIKEITLTKYNWEIKLKSKHVKEIIIPLCYNKKE